LPQASPNARASLEHLVVGRVVRTTSTSFISCTGLKKCRPTKRSGRPEAVAISPIGNELVFEAKIVSACRARRVRRRASS
jgi:hypothetical protein